MAELKKVFIPDIGDFKDIPVIEILVKAGDEVKTEDSLITLESDKATIEIPSPYSGVIKELFVKAGDKVSEGTAILIIQISNSAPVETSHQAAEIAPIQKDIAAQPEIEVKQAATQPIQNLPQNTSPVINTFSKAHASPSIRRFARELGVNLDLITGSGPKHRILKEDVQAYVKNELSKSRSDGTGST